MSFDCDLSLGLKLAMFLRVVCVSPLTSVKKETRIYSKATFSDLKFSEVFRTDSIFDRVSNASFESRDFQELANLPQRSKISSDMWLSNGVACFQGSRITSCCLPIRPL